jgi:hypothetical protein
MAGSARGAVETGRARCDGRDRADCNPRRRPCNGTGARSGPSLRIPMRLGSDLREQDGADVDGDLGLQGGPGEAQRCPGGHRR